MKAIREAPLRYLGAILLLTAAYAASGRVGLGLAHEQVNATLVWPPTGLALAALLLYGLRLWPGVFLGAVIVNLLIGTSPAPALSIAIGNTLEALTGYWLLRHVLPFDLGFRRPLDVVVFIAAAALLASTVSATIGVGSLVAFGSVPGSAAGATWLTWLLGDAGGAVVVGPVLLLMARGTPSWRSLANRWETWFVLFLLCLTGVPAFFAPHSSRWAALFVSNLTIPPVAWAGLRLGHRGAAVAIVVVAGLASLGTSQGLGPYSVAPNPARLLLLWAYLTSISATALILAATAAERAAAAQARLDDAERGRELMEQVLTLRRLESLGLLAASVAHDFNNLLAAIMGNCGLLKASAPGPEEREQIENVLLASRRAAALCNNLLSYSGRSVHRFTNLSLQDLTRPLPKLLEGVWPEGVRLEVEAQDAPSSVRGDFSELTQVVMNLTLNAGQAAGATAVKVRFGTRDFAPEDLAGIVPPTQIEPGLHGFVEVEDDGSGLSPDVRERLFDPFFTTKPEGRGLGLATALGIVSGHEAALLLDTELGRGTRIVVVFPASTSLPPTTPPPEPLSASAPPAPRELEGEARQPETPTEEGAGEEESVPAKSSLRILLADDAAPVLAVTRLCLLEVGHVVVTAVDGQEAVDVFLASEEPFDLAVLDVTMPKKSGLEVLPLLREAQPALPVVLMSGYSAEDLDPGQLGVEFLSKPFVFEELLEAIQRIVPKS